MKKFNLKEFLIITLLTSIWINASEVFRYFVLIRPKIQSFFQGKKDVAEMDWVIFSIWGLWDTLLTAALVFIFWLCLQTFGSGKKTTLLSGIVVWAVVFVVFWVANANMGLSSWDLLLIALPFSLFEMLVGAWIASRLYLRKSIKLTSES